MARTIRTVMPKSKRWLDPSKRRDALFLKGVRSYRGHKCGSANIDIDGYTKLNTYDSSTTRREANQAIRRGGKLQVRRALDEI